MHKIDVYLKNEFQLGEGPHWDEKSQTLLTVDITAAAVVRWDPVVKKCKRIVLPEYSSVGAVVPQSNSEDLLVCANDRFVTLNESTSVVKEFATLESNGNRSRLNDAKCDASGRLIAGTMGEESSPGVVPSKAGKLYSLERDGKVRILKEDIDISNGLAWTSDNQTMFYIDSLKFCVYLYDYDITNGSISNEKIVVKFDRNKEGIPDGMCIDANGDIYVAMFFGGQVIKINPTTGKKIQEIKIENCPKITSACFGGPTYEDLYVTSAHNHFKGTGTEKPEDSGSLFKISSLGVKGLPGVSYSPTTTK